MRPNKIIAAAAVIAAFLAAHGVLADEAIKVNYNGKAIAFDVEPQLIEDRTMVPLRAIFEAMGARVDYDEKRSAISAVRGNIKIETVVGENIIIKTTYPVYESETESETESENNEYVTEHITIDVPSLIVDDRTLVPVRAVSESFECTVSWDDASKTVDIRS